MLSKISMLAHGYLIGNNGLNNGSDMLYEFLINDDKSLLIEFLSLIKLLEQKELIPINSVIDKVNITGYNFLQIAFAKQRVDVAETLLENGANPDCVTPGDHSLLHDVSVLKNNEAIRLLLRFKIKFEAKSKHGITLFFAAITGNFLPAAIILTEVGANIDCIDNEVLPPYCTA